ncbi:MAG: arsenate reductase ArsC [Anaerolineae bacterium]|jgi:arsenate reductase
MQKTKVLFLCTGNSARSQMAEAFLRRRAGDLFEVHSAGLEPKGINPFTVRVMQEIGYDLSEQRAKDVIEYLGKVHFGYLITVCAHAEEHCPKTFLGVSERIHWPVDDPAAFIGSEAETLQRFRQARDEIAARIEAWLAELGISSESAL